MKYVSNESQKRLTKTIRKTVISIVVMIIIFILAGVAYVYYSGTHSEPYEPPKPDSNNTIKALPKPVLPGPNAPEGVALASITSPVKAGDNTGISIRTNPTSKCDISVKYDDKPAKDSGLVTKTADDYGTLSWTWTVSPNAPAGKWPVKITCYYNKKSGVLIGDLVVTK